MGRAKVIVAGRLEKFDIEDLRGQSVIVLAPASLGDLQEIAGAIYQEVLVTRIPTEQNAGPAPSESADGERNKGGAT